MRTTAMVMLIVLAAFFLNFVMVSIGLTGAITDAIKGLELPGTGVILLLVALYLVLGCFMETLSLMIATTGRSWPGWRLSPGRSGCSACSPT